MLSLVMRQRTAKTGRTGILSAKRGTLGYPETRRELGTGGRKEGHHNASVNGTGFFFYRMVMDTVNKVLLDGVDVEKY